MEGIVNRENAELSIRVCVCVAVCGGVCSVSMFEASYCLQKPV